MKTYLFDFDGTIADTFKFAVELSDILLPEFGMKKIDPKDYEHYRSLSIPQIIKELKVPKRQIPNIALRIRKLINQKIESLEPIDGIIDVINKLHEDGNQLGILSSNNKANIGYFLEKNKIDSYFSFVDTKANPLVRNFNLRQSIKKHKINKANMIYLGDELKDLNAAKFNKVKFIAVSWGLNNKTIFEKKGAKIIVDKPAEILKVSF